MLIDVGPSCVEPLCSEYLYIQFCNPGCENGSENSPPQFSPLPPLSGTPIPLPRNTRWQIGRIQYRITEHPDPGPMPGCVEVKKSNGFWRIKRLYRKKKSKMDFEKYGKFDDDKSETWVYDVMGVSRSRSVCSFRDESSDYAFSSTKISDLTSGVFIYS
ncbi:uncharacterized protein Fot_49997 [Forsythia ovata]|uniref:Uncharacterized protein n=1 Tax=Forsythia ovata TaxID=205694 RepID=A0ABD1PWW7_9LAMI